MEYQRESNVVFRLLQRRRRDLNVDLARGHSKKREEGSEPTEGGLRLVEFRRKEVFPLHPSKAFVFCNCGDLDWPADRFRSRDRKTNKSFRGFNHKSPQIYRVLNRCSWQDQCF